MEVCFCSTLLFSWFILDRFEHLPFAKTLTNTTSWRTKNEGYRNHLSLLVQTVYKGPGGKGGWNGVKGACWSVQKYFNSGKDDKGANHSGKGQWSKTGQDRRKGQERGGKGDPRVCWARGKIGHIEAKCLKEGTKEPPVKKCMRTQMSCMRCACWK